MLKDDFFHITAFEAIEDQTQASIKLNADHAILKGHFPEMPVVPGVCMVQMLKEVTEKQLQKKLTLRRAPVIKFLSVMQPGPHPEVKLDINIKETEEGAFAVNGRFYFEDVTFFKFKGHFDEQA